VTGLSNNKLLRASHIYPWKLSTNTERLDKMNGLLLTPNLDQTFDQGLISFDDQGTIIIKEGIFNRDELLSLNINKNMKLRLLEEKHQYYLQKHRQLHQFE
jgi:putative restriction endonuclease